MLGHGRRALAYWRTLYPSGALRGWTRSRRCVSGLNAMSASIKIGEAPEEIPALYCSDRRTSFNPQRTGLSTSLNGAEFASGPANRSPWWPVGHGKIDASHVAGLLEAPQMRRGLLFGGCPDRPHMDGQRGAPRLRQRTRSAIVYQFHHLLPEFSGAGECGDAGSSFTAWPRGGAQSSGAAIVSNSWASARAAHASPLELSGGETAAVWAHLARAVANAPRLLLADEPTGNLDPQTAGHVFNTLVSLVRATGLAALIATHNVEIASRMDRIITIADGKVIDKV